MSDYKMGGFWINENRENLNRMEQALQTAYKKKGVTSGYIDYALDRDRAMLLRSGKPDGCYDFTSEEFRENP